jgi:hypothetical protein
LGILLCGHDPNAVRTRRTIEAKDHRMSPQSPAQRHNSEVRRHTIWTP